MEFSGFSHFVNTIGALLLVDILLSGDNAMVIAMACRALPPAQRRQAMMIGTVGAIGMRVLMIAVAGAMLEIPLLKIVGGLLLIAIALKMLADDHGPHHEAKPGQAATELWAAVGTVITADFIMSLDNVVGLAAVADGNLVALAIGLAMSIPLLMWGSRWVGSMIDRWPALVPFGAAVLGWIGGGIAVGDPLVADWVNQQSPALTIVLPTLGAIFVLAEGRIMRRTRPALAPMRERIERVEAARRAAREAAVAQPLAQPLAQTAVEPSLQPLAQASAQPLVRSHMQAAQVLAAPACAPTPVTAPLPAAQAAPPIPPAPPASVPKTEPAIEATPDAVPRRAIDPRWLAIAGGLFAVAMVVILVMDWKPNPNQLQRYNCLKPKASVEYRAGSTVLRLTVGPAYASGTLKPDNQIEWNEYHAVTGVLGIAPPTRVVPDDAQTIELDGGGFARVQCTLGTP